MPRAGNQAREVRADCGDEVVHVLELLLGHQSIPCLGKDGPPVHAGEGVKWCNERHRVLLDPEGAHRLRLPGLELKCCLCELVTPRAGMLQVVEPSAAGDLKPGHGADVSVQGTLGCRWASETCARCNLLQKHDYFLGRQLGFALRLDVGLHQAFLDGLPFCLETFETVRVKEAKPGREPTQGVPDPLEFMWGDLLVPQGVQQGSDVALFPWDCC